MTKQIYSEEMLSVLKAIATNLQPHVPSWVAWASALSPIILTAIIIAITIYYNRKGLEFQKKAHRATIKNSYREKYLEIYNAYVDCMYVLSLDTYTMLFTVKYPETFCNKLITHRSYMRSISNQVQFFFREDIELKIKLEELYDDFFKLSTTYLSLTKDAALRGSEVLVQIKEEFPHIKVDNENFLQNILVDEDAKSRFAELHTNALTLQFDENFKAFEEKFRYENFDKHFEKYFDFNE